MNLLLALALAAARPSPASPAGALWSQELPPALAAAKGKKSLVLVDFYAPWCYSCYYMDENVMNQPALRALAPRLELVKMDVDSPEGARLKREWKVRFLPSYVIVDPDGLEVGRIMGEQTRSDFFSRLTEVLDRHSTLEDLKARLAASPPSQSGPAAAEILRAYVQRGAYEEGLAWLKGLPGPFKAAADDDPASRREIIRLELQQASRRKDAAVCLLLAKELSRLETGCALPYDAEQARDCLEGRTPDKKALARAERAPLEALLERGVFGPSASRCPDLRSPVEAAADAYEALGEAPLKSALLDKAAALMRSDLGGRLDKDRNEADNLRAFLELAGRDQELEALYPELMRAYPDDYVYAYRFGKFLLARGRAADALKQFDAALPKAYGANRLSVVEQRARALRALGRSRDALKAVEQALKDNPASFPDQVASLGRLKDELGK